MLATRDPCATGHWSAHSELKTLQYQKSKTKNLKIKYN
jgi:hypothetical protein